MIKVKFVDFWHDENNHMQTYFCQLLSKKYEVELSDDPDIIFYSNFGKEHLKYKCIRIFVSSENVRPDFTCCDYAITFDYLKTPRHYRFPLWASYYIGYLRWNWGAVNSLHLDIENKLFEQWKNKSKFCCFMVSNSACKKRNDFFLKLTQRKHVDSAGRHLNNIGYLLEGGTGEKIKFIQDYRFIISFENSTHPGYTTEKILEPLLTGSIPIYWGDPMVKNEFNPKRFINVSDFDNDEEVIEHILKLDENPELAFKILKEKCFVKGTNHAEELEKGLADFLFKIADSKDSISPVAQSLYYRILYRGKAFLQRVKNKLNRLKQIN